MIDVFSQGYAAALLLCVGIAPGLLYDLFSRLRLSAGRVLCHALDGALLLLMTALLALGVLLASNGRMRLFYIVFDALGAVLSAWAFWPLFFRKPPA